MRSSKIGLCICCILLLLDNSTHAQKIELERLKQTADSVYSIQFFASEYSGKPFKQLSELGEVIHEKIPFKELYRYKLGYYKTEREASFVLEKLIDLGFADSFVHLTLLDREEEGNNVPTKASGVPVNHASTQNGESRFENQSGDSLGFSTNSGGSNSEGISAINRESSDSNADGNNLNVDHPILPPNEVTGTRKLSILYTGKSLGVLGSTRFQKEHDRIIDYAIDHDLEFKLVSHACWRARGLTVFLPSDEPLGHELELILAAKKESTAMDSVPSLITKNVILFQDPEMQDLDMLEIMNENDLANQQFPEIQKKHVKLYRGHIEDEKPFIIVEEQNAEWPVNIAHWSVGEINRIDFGKLSRVFELPYNQGNFGSRATVLQFLKNRIEHSDSSTILMDLGHRHADLDIELADRVALDVSGINRLGYHILVPFENELASDPETLAELKSKYPVMVFLGTNISSGKENIWENYVIKNYGPISIGLIGLVDPALQTNLSGKQLHKLDFKDLFNSAQKAVDKLLEKQVDLIVAASNLKSEDNAMLAERIKGIDIIVANLTSNGTPFAHTKGVEIPHDSKRSPGRPYFLSNNFDYGIAVGKIELEFSRNSDSDKYILTRLKEKNFPVNDQIPSDTLAIRELTSSIEQIKREKGDLMFPAFIDIIEQEKDLEDYDETTRHGRISKPLWENFIATLLRKGAPAEIAIIRQVPSFLPLIGKLHEREVRSWLWIEDHIVMMDVKGKDLRRLFDSGRAQHLVTSGVESYHSARGNRYLIMGRPLIDDAYYRVATTNVISKGSLEEYFRYALRVNEEFTVEENGQLKQQTGKDHLLFKEYVISELKRIRSFGKGKDHHKRIASLLKPEVPYEKLFTFEFVRPTLWSSLNQSFRNEGYESVPESRIISNNSFIIGAEGGFLLTLDGLKSAWDFGAHFAFAQQNASIGEGLTQKTETIDDINFNLTYRFKGKRAGTLHPFIRLEYDSEFTPTFNSATQVDNPKQSILRSVVGLSKGFSPKWPKVEMGLTAQNDFSNEHYQYGFQWRSVGRFPLDREWRIVYILTNRFDYFLPTSTDTERELAYKFNMINELNIPLFGDLSLSVAGDLLFFKGKTDLNSRPGMNLLIRVGLTYNRLWKPRFQSLF